ncbi:MAG: metallophosphoesterase [Leptospiraceae bacterium]|nr:metallophosphoesterase [Leptospiraceae bacterium]MCP5497976.1 metallophosphoesterase [Leptospiraceae bacterium]
MKIIYLTDIHDGLRGLKELFLRTSPDLYLLCGDLIYKAFFSVDRIIEFCTYQEELDVIAKQENFNLTVYDYATRAIRFPKRFSEDIINKSINYRNLFQQASKTMKEKYQLVENLVNQYANSPTLFLPGNYDLDLQYTALYDKDLHRKSSEIDGIKLTGYGGAPIATSGIPEKLAVKFHEYHKDGSFYSEPEDFLKEELPDIAVVHTPARGFLDKVPSFGNVGSDGIRRYVDECAPPLLVSGHVHEDQGIIKKNGTILLNSSNFGPVESIFGYQSGGFFAEILIENKSILSVGLYKLIDNKEIVHLIEVDCSEKDLKASYVNPDSTIDPDRFIQK